MMGSNTCVCCGEEIPEGFQVCKGCESGVKELRSNRDKIRSMLSSAKPCSLLRVGFVEVYKTAQGCYRLSNYQAGTSCLPLDLAVEVLVRKS